MDDKQIDPQDERIIEEEKNIFKKKINKKANSLKKKIFAVIKAVIVPMLLAVVKILLPILVVILIVSLFCTIFGGGGDSDDIDGIYSTDDYVIAVEQENAAPVLDEDQLEEAIEALYDGRARENLLSAIDGLIEIQETYKVNAVFAIAVFQMESNCGTNWAAIDPETYNWMSFTKGSWTGEVYTGRDGRQWRKYNSFNDATIDFGKVISNTYFSQARYSVVAINDLENYDTAYCEGEEEWTEGVLSIMTSIYEAAGIEIYNTEYHGDSAIVEFALQFVGEGHRRFTSYKPTENNTTFYGMPMTCNGNWCAMFVSYCFHQCELIPSVLPRPYRGCIEYKKMKEQTDRWRSKSSNYIPNPGDIIFFDYKGTGEPGHTGIVIECDGIKVRTVEGNTGRSSTDPYWKGSKVCTQEYSINSKAIFGYYAI